MTDQVFLHVELRISAKEFVRFVDTMQHVWPLIEEAGWKFVGAWKVRVGVANSMRVIWSIADANAFFNERPGLLSHPRFAEFRAVIDAAVLEESVTIMTALPYGKVP